MNSLSFILIASSVIGCSVASDTIGYPCVDEGYYAHPTSCEMYVQCVKGKNNGKLVAIVGYCDQGYTWDNRLPGGRDVNKCNDVPCNDDNDKTSHEKDEGDHAEGYECNDVNIAIEVFLGESADWVPNTKNDVYVNCPKGYMNSGNAKIDYVYVTCNETTNWKWIAMYKGDYCKQVEHVDKHPEAIQNFCTEDYASSMEPHGKVLAIENISDNGHKSEVVRARVQCNEGSYASIKPYGQEVEVVCRFDRQTNEYRWDNQVGRETCLQACSMDYFEQYNPCVKAPALQYNVLFLNYTVETECMNAQHSREKRRPNRDAIVVVTCELNERNSMPMIRVQVPHEAECYQCMNRYEQKVVKNKRSALHNRQE